MTGVTWSPASGNVFTEIEATITFTDDDVRAVYVDWDDGASNKKDEANYQWVQFTEPKAVWSGNHTYTASGAYNPVIQTMNSKGFFSKYYTSGTAGVIGVNTEVSPSVGDTGINTIAIYDGQATGIMRVENKTVKSGIDNSILDEEGDKDLYLMLAPLCTSGALDTINSITVEIEAVVGSTIYDSADTTTSIGAGKSVQTLSVTLSSLGAGSGLTDVPIVGGRVSEVLKVTYKNPKYVTDVLDFDANDAYKNLKIFVVVKGNDDNYYPITYVSAGCPIKKSNDSLRNISMDFSQSRAKASNISLNSYRYDNGKMWLNPVNQWVVSGNIFGDQTKQTSQLKSMAYTYSNVRPDGLGGEENVVDSLGATRSLLAFDSTSLNKWAQDSISKSQKYRVDQFIVDEFGNFTPQYHLLRMSADPNTSGTGSVANVSSIVDNKPYVFRMTPAITWDFSDGPTKIDAPSEGTGDNETKEYTTQAFSNGSTQMVNLSGMNTQTFEYIGGSARTANEYILLLFSKKTNKIFFNMNNYANNLINTNLSGTSFTTPWKISGISYLVLENSATITQNAYWKAVEFDDTTKVSMEYIDTSSDTYTEQNNSLSQSGYLSFDMPLDWSATTMKQLCGGQLAPSAAASAAGDDDIILTGTCGTSTTVTNYGKQNPVTLNAESITKMSNNSLTDDEVGSFKYGFIINTGTGADRFYWVASGASNGYTGSTGILNLHYGASANQIEPASTITGSLRRINIYDIVNGYSKLYRGASDSILVPVDADLGAWTNKYVVDVTGSGVGEDLLDAWKSNELYALKISLSGAAGVNVAGSDGYQEDIYPELWNIFDATRGYEAIVKEIDDSAYNLNALPVTSDVSIGRGGTYYSAITRKGKVFIARTGDKIENISLSSVALGDGTFDTYSADSSMYGQLRKIRKLHANVCRVYWDEPQKDGTYVRYWGIITQVDETHGSGGPKSVINYNFNIMLEDIALIDSSGNLMTDLFPLGGISGDRNYS